MRTQKVRWFPAETVSVSIGQAMSLTPVQLARVAAVVANGGRLPRPHLMKAIGGRAVNTDAARGPRLPARGGGHGARRDARRW